MEAAAWPAEPDPHGPLARPRFALLAAAAFTWFAVLLFAHDWTPAVCFLIPAFVIGCRYLEIARYEVVHCSRWLLLLVSWCLVLGVPLAMPYLPIEIAQPRWLVIVFAVLLLTAGGHLFVVQRRLLQQRCARGVQDRSQPCTDWACGGLLAAIPPFLLAGLGDLLVGWRDPWAWVPQILGAALLVLQLRRNRLFPWLTMVCLVAWAGIDALALLSADIPGPAWVVAWNCIATCGPMLVLAVYLASSPRVRRTFSGRS